MEDLIAAILEQKVSQRFVTAHIKATRAGQGNLEAKMDIAIGAGQEAMADIQEKMEATI
jgi:hypothetical protein